MTDRTDNFNRADTTNAIGTPSDGGSAWSQLSGAWGIASNQGYESTGSGVAALEASVADADVQVTAAVIGANFGLVARLADVNNFLLFRSDAHTTIEMFKCVAGSFTSLGSASYTPVNGDILKYSVSGSTLNGYINGVLTVGPVTDGAGSTNTKHGLRNNDTTVRMDTFSITGTGGGGTPILDERHYPRGVHRGFARAA